MNIEKDKWFPKVLIISANCFSTEKNNGKTLASLFAAFPQEKLAQFYIWPEYPNNDVCINYYRLTDMDMVKTLLNRRKTCGNIVYSQQYQEDSSIAPVFKKQFSQWPVFRLAREFVWLGKRWRSGGLLSWVKDFSPDVIFFCGINNPSLFRITNTICKELSIPVITYITDDYYLPRFSLSPSYHIRRLWLVHSMNKLLHTNKSALITINDYMRQSYLNLFGKDSSIAFNCTPITESCPQNANPGNSVLRMVYIGSLSHNRWKSLAFIGEALGHSHIKDKFTIEIYAREVPEPNVMKAISKPPYIQYCGSLDADNVIQMYKKADILIHAESFDYVSRKNTKLSLSTKIPEYMASGKAIFAIGPPEIASMRFLADNSKSVCVTRLDEQNIIQALSSLCDFKKRIEIGQVNWQSIKKIENEFNMYDLVRNITVNLCKEQANAFSE